MQENKNVCFFSEHSVILQVY